MHAKSRSIERRLEENKKNEEEFMHEELKITKIRKEKSLIKRLVQTYYALDEKLITSYMTRNKKYNPIIKIKKIEEMKAKLIMKNLQKELDLFIDDEFFEIHENKLKKSVSSRQNYHSRSFDVRFNFENLFMIE